MRHSGGPSRAAPSAATARSVRFSRAEEREALPPEGSPDADTSSSVAAGDYAPATGRFADGFSSLPPHERLTARIWFPVQELADVRTVARHALRANAVARALDPGLDLAHALVHRLDGDRATFNQLQAWAFTAKLARDLNVARALARALDPALDRDLAHLLVVDRASALTRDVARALALAQDVAGALARRSTSVGRRVTDLAHARMVALDCVLDVARGLAEYHPSARDFVRELERGWNDEKLIEAIDQLNEAVTSWWEPIFQRCGLARDSPGGPALVSWDPVARGKNRSDATRPRSSLACGRSVPEVSSTTTPRHHCQRCSSGLAPGWWRPGQAWPVGR